MEKEIQMVTDYLDKIAIKLGVGVDKIWPWFIKQEYVDAITSLLYFVIIIPVTLKVYLFAMKHWENICKKDHEVIWLVLLAFLTILSLCSILIFFSEFPDIFNAEYWAFKSLIGSIR